MSLRSEFRLSPPVCGALLAIAGLLLFHFFGNATRGYIDTPSLFVWWGRQWLDPRADAQHGPLVLLVAAWLVWRNLRAPDAKEAAGPLLAPGLALLSALILHVIGFGAQQTRISIVALLLYIWGIAGLLGGPRWSRATLFPLGFVLLAVPVGFLESLGFYLRYAVTVSAEWVASAVGVPVQRSGTQLLSPDGRFQYEVAAACSGIRSLVALFALGVLVGYLRYSGFWARAAFATLTVPFAYLGNLLRILAIVFAGHRWGHEAGEKVHTASGVLVFVVVLALLLGVARFGQRARKEAAAEGARDDEDSLAASPRPERPRGRVAGTTLLILIAAACSVVLLGRLERRPSDGLAGIRLTKDGREPVALPEFLGTEWIGQRVDVTTAERDILPPDTGYSRRNYVSVQDRGRQVFLSIVLSGKDRSSIHRPELCILGQGWDLESRKEHTFTLGDGTRLPVTLLTLRTLTRDRSGRTVAVRNVLAYWFVGADALVASHPGMIWRSAVNRLRRFQPDRWAYVVAQAPLREGETEALVAIQEVLNEAWPAVAAQPAGSS